MTNREQAEELARRLDHIGRVDLYLTAHELWAVIAALQLAWRHPRIGLLLKEHLWRIGHELSTLLPDDQLLTDVLNVGWVAALDVPQPECEDDGL